MGFERVVSVKLWVNLGMEGEMTSEEKMTEGKIGKDAVSRIAGRLEEELKRWRDRPWNEPIHTFTWMPRFSR